MILCTFSVQEQGIRFISLVTDQGQGVFVYHCDSYPMPPPSPPAHSFIRVQAFADYF